MAGDTVQSGQTSNSSPNTTCAVTLSGTAAGNTVLAFLGGVAMDTKSPSISGFTQIGTIPTIDGYAVGVWQKNNIAGGSLTVTASYGSTDFTSMVVCEVSGVSASPLIGAANSTQGPLGTPSTDNITVGPPTPNNTGNAFVIGYCLADTGLAPTTGTGYTSKGTFIDFGGGNISALEQKNVSSASTAATWTSTANGDILISFDIVLALTAAAVSDTLFFGSGTTG